MKKILIISTVARQFYLFEKGNIEVLKSLGYEVHGAANLNETNERLNEVDITLHHFNIQRSPFSLKNFKAYKELKKIIKKNHFDVVHCHSPMGGVLGRIAAKSAKIKRIVYTVHGFHFFKGAPVINWLIFYPIEKWLSRYTDVLITINHEDYKRTKSKLNAKRVEYIPGIGVDLKKINLIALNKEEKRKDLNLLKDDIVILSIGELNKNKNHKIAIKALSNISNKQIQYLICGQGYELEKLRKLRNKLGLNDQVQFLGYRNDILEILQIADVFVLPSFREGLSVSLMEALASGLPVVCSKIRGNVDLIEDKLGGYLMDPNDVNSYANAFKILITDLNLRQKMRYFDLRKIKEFDSIVVNSTMKLIYEQLFL